MKLSHLIKCLTVYGIVNLFKRPNDATKYWRNIADAMYSHEYLTKRKQILKVSAVEVDKIFPDLNNVPITLIDYVHQYGDILLNEIILLCKIVRHLDPQAIFEMGTYLGETTYQMAANCGGKIYTLDLPPKGHKNYVEPKHNDPDLDVYPESPVIRFQWSSFKNQIEQLFGDSTTFDYSSFENKIDLVFVDACHHYEYVVKDSQSALGMKSRNGIIIWHDYAPYAPGVVKALNELSESVELLHIAGTSLCITPPMKSKSIYE